MSGPHLRPPLGACSTLPTAALPAAKLVVMVAALLAGAAGCRPATQPASVEAPIRAVPGSRGSLVVSAYGVSSEQLENPTVHHSVLYRGAHGVEMEDNDIRGFLDGNFRWAWNQPSQIHVRVGRKGRNPRYGEFELFRILQRWELPLLPPSTRIQQARLVLHVEEGPDEPVRLLLYEVKRDWNPGQGGLAGDNVSPPRSGEVWWNDAAFGRDSWGLPGVGYAADGDPQADTGELALAEASWSPGDETLTLESLELALYVERQTRRGRPLRFLVKVADYQEDLPGLRLTVYSANVGLDRNPVRRPKLELHWSSPTQVISIQRNLHLEHGRTHISPRIPVRGARRIAGSFLPDEGSGDVTLEVRGGQGTQEGPASLWQPLQPVVAIDPSWRWLQLRVRAARDPVPLGDWFSASLRDTWVRSDAPEKQELAFEFVSPTGRIHRRLASYQGEHRWRVEFQPDELGPWRYRWSHRFDGAPFEGAPGRFDAIAGSRYAVHAALQQLAAELEARPLAPESPARAWYMVRFARLERAAVGLETPPSFRGEPGRELEALLDRVRAALGEPVPDVLPMEPAPEPAWRSPAPRGES